MEKIYHLSEELKRSRTGTVDNLITHYEFYSNSTGGENINVPLSKSKRKCSRSSDSKANAIEEV